MNPSEPSDLTTLLDPETDPSASYALDQAMVRRLTALLVASGEESKPAVSPVNGQPLGYVPQSTADDVEEAFRRARKAQAEWVRTPLEERERIFLRLHDLVLERQDEIIDL